MAKKRKPRIGRPPTGKLPAITIRWPYHVLGALEAYAEEECLDRAGALRSIVGKFLIEKGKLKQQ